MPQHHTDTTPALTRAGLLAAVVMLGLLGGLGYGGLRPTTYSAHAHVMVAAPESAGPAAISFAQAYGRLATLTETLALASPPLSPASLNSARKHLQVSTSPDAPLIRLTGSARTPEEAASFANAAATALAQYGNAHRRATGVGVVLMNIATPPKFPSGPNLPVSALVGTAAGVLLAMLIAATGWDRRWSGIRRSNGRLASPRRRAARETDQTRFVHIDFAHDDPDQADPAEAVRPQNDSAQDDPAQADSAKGGLADADLADGDPESDLTDSDLADSDLADSDLAGGDPRQAAPAQGDPAPAGPAQTKKVRAAQPSAAKAQARRSRARKSQARKSRAARSQAEKEQAADRPRPEETAETEAATK